MTRLNFISYRQINTLLFLGPAGLLSFGYYLQYAQDLEPCPLCMTQRIAFYLLATVAFIAIITPQKMFLQHLWSAITALFAATGFGVATRQVWLQHLPEDQVPACGPSFDFIVETFPFSEAIAIMFRGTGSCAEVVWAFLGFSIPEWSLVAFTGLFCLSILSLFKK